jgi:hypothetical protein
MGADDYYAVLGVSRAENLQGIHTAYRTLAKQCHPDRAGIEGTERFQAIQEAYEVLSDPHKRKEHDADIDRRRRLRAPTGVTPEPFAPVHTPYPSRMSGPEPLVKPTVQPESLFAPAPASCEFCNAGNVAGAPCPFCQEFEVVEQNIEKFMLGFLQALRIGRF